MASGFKQLLRPTADLCTSVEIRGDRAIYEVRTSNPLYQDRLQHIGFAFAGEGQFTRHLSASGDIWRTHSNVGRHLEELLYQSARLRPLPWEASLDLFLHRVQGTPLRWFLYGSGALAVRGIDAQNIFPISPRSLALHQSAKSGWQGVPQIYSRPVKLQNQFENRQGFQREDDAEAAIRESRQNGERSFGALSLIERLRHTYCRFGKPVGGTLLAEYALTNILPGIFFGVQIKVAKKRSHPTALPDGEEARSKLTNRDQAGGLPLGTD
jgi:hypothetical protein